MSDHQIIPTAIGGDYCSYVYLGLLRLLFYRSLSIGNLPEDQI